VTRGVVGGEQSCFCWKMKSTLRRSFSLNTCRSGRVIAFSVTLFMRAERQIQGVTVNLNVNHFSQLTTGIKFSPKQHYNAGLLYAARFLICTYIYILTGKKLV
jgi:hypothetical protein